MYCPTCNAEVQLTVNGEERLKHCCPYCLLKYAKRRLHITDRPLDEKVKKHFAPKRDSFAEALLYTIFNPGGNDHDSESTTTGSVRG